MVDASQRSTLPQFLADARAAFLVPVVINAMEVHARCAPVITRASRLLSCLANISGRLRANLVAAGVLPALCSALRLHDASTAEAAIACIHALCDLAAELCAARGAPPAARRSLCEALASTGCHRQVPPTFGPSTLAPNPSPLTRSPLLLQKALCPRPSHSLLERALRSLARPSPFVPESEPRRSMNAQPQVLRALRAHIDHAGIVGAACKVLLSFQEEYEGSGKIPPPLVSALRSQETLHALERAQRTFAHHTEIQLAAEWAVGVGRVARVGQRWLGKAAATERDGVAAERAASEAHRTPHKHKRPPPVDAAEGTATVGAASAAESVETTPPVKARAAPALSPLGPASPNRSRQPMQTNNSESTCGPRSAGKSANAKSKACKEE